MPGEYIRYYLKNTKQDGQNYIKKIKNKLHLCSTSYLFNIHWLTCTFKKYLLSCIFKFIALEANQSIYSEQDLYPIQPILGYKNSKFGFPTLKRVEEWRCTLVSNRQEPRIILLCRFSKRS